VETHDISPDGEWLAYDTNLHGDADIYKIRLTGGPPVPLVIGPEVAGFPRWSPDGREIAFYGGEAIDLFVISSDGGTPTRLTSGAGFEENPLWAPDGLSIVYRSAGNGRPEAWIVSRRARNEPWSAPRQLTQSGCAFLAWMRDGSGVLCGNPHRTVFTLVAPTGAILRRYDLAECGISEPGPPVLSPDGATVYLRATREGEQGIWACRLGGKESRLVTSLNDPYHEILTYPGTINVAGDRLYLTVSEWESDIWVMDLLRQ
jgi:Tol biopolymer transport system component